MAAKFDHYQSLSTDEDRQAFWNDVEKRASKLTPDQRLAAQTNVRENVEQILCRMETIEQQLIITENA